METTPRTVLEDVVGEGNLFGPSGACPTLFDDGNLDRVLVISGENAGGKSFMCKALMHYATERDPGMRMEFVGMSRRTQGGMHRVAMWGDDTCESTGRNSVGAVLNVIRWSGREDAKREWIVLDEPDIGLSEGYAAAMGERLVQFVAEMPDTVEGLVVVSHSRPLVRHLVEAGAMSVRVGDDMRPVAEWIRDGDLPKSLEDLEGLKARSRGRSKAIQHALNERKERRKVQAPTMG